MQLCMKPGTAKTSEATALVETALRGELSRTQARRLYRLGAETVTLSLLAASKRIGEQGALIAELHGPAGGQEPSPSMSPATSPSTSPATPSGMIPIYEKPAARKRRKKPGGRQGHPCARQGHRRSPGAWARPTGSSGGAACHADTNRPSAVAAAETLPALRRATATL